MKVLTVVMVVLLMLAFTAATYAQGANTPAPGGDRGGRGGDRGAGVGAGGGDRGAFAGALQRMGGFGMAAAPPAVMTFEGFIYVILGNVIYKVDPQTVQVVGATFLMPPGVVTAGVQ